MDKENLKVSLQPIFDAEKHWILSCGKDLDEPYVVKAGDDRVITLHDMLNDIDECNEKAIKQAQDLVELTCEMFIRPSSFIEKIKEEEQENAIQAFKIICNKCNCDNSDSIEQEFKALLNKNK